MALVNRLRAASLHDTDVVLDAKEAAVLLNLLAAATLCAALEELRPRLETAVDAVEKA